MNVVRNILTKLAKAQKKYKWQIMIAVLLVTVFMIVGATKLQVQSDLTKEMPNDLPVYQIDERVNEKFGGQDAIVIVINLDETSDSDSAPKDITDEKVITFISNLQTELSKESSIYSVTSPASYPAGSAARNSFFSEDKKTAMMYVQIDVGSGDKKINEVTELVKSKANSLSVPSGVNVYVTGNPAMRVVIFDLMIQDAVFTIIIAALIILLLLVVMLRSVTKGIVVFMPLLLGLIWTMGTMGWIGLKISIATAGLGAMILGLGVEYGIFMFTRYHEERESGKSQEDALNTSVPGVGFAVFGSGITVIIGFGALTLSAMPMLRHLGLSLALGIVFSLIAALVVAPVLSLYEEDFEYWKAKRDHKRVTEKRKLHERMQR